MELVHVLSRGIEKRKIFMDDQDRFRFVHDLFEFNDQAPVTNNLYNFRKNRDNSAVGRRVKSAGKPRRLLVNVHAFCLMPNHYHLLLSPRIKDEIPKFMQKLNAGYVLYFNERYERRGTLFEGRYKSIVVKDHSHLLHLPYYIHLNPLDLSNPGWRDRELQDYKKAWKSLGSYRWSSHLDYVGVKNFPSVTQREFLLELFGGSNGYQKGIKRWLKEIDTKLLEYIALEGR